MVSSPAGFSISGAEPFPASGSRFLASPPYPMRLRYQNRRGGAGGVLRADCDSPSGNVAPQGSSEGHRLLEDFIRKGPVMTGISAFCCSTPGPVYPPRVRGVGSTLFHTAEFPGEPLRTPPYPESPQGAKSTASTSELGTVRPRPPEFRSTRTSPLRRTASRTFRASAQSSSCTAAGELQGGGQKSEREREQHCRGKARAPDPSPISRVTTAASRCRPRGPPTSSRRQARRPDAEPIRRRRSRILAPGGPGDLPQATLNPA